jgi:hypothetical protein
MSYPLLPPTPIISICFYAHKSFQKRRASFSAQDLPKEIRVSNLDNFKRFNRTRATQ